MSHANLPATRTALDDTPRVRPPYRLQWEAAQDAWVLLYPEGMIKLNRSAGEIMQRCNGERSVQAIVTELEQAFQTTSLQADVLAFVDMARAQRWLDITPVVPA
ncbi:MAG: pyrroloquinoline quinone biosynthesis peptide chaperone PqqD [Aquabacterium sp.]